MKKICVWCGCEFETKSGKQLYCKNIHYDKCVICGSEFVVKNEYLSSPERPRTCSKECRNILRSNTCTSKYGGTAPIFSSEVKDKMKTTNLERYGVDNGAKSEKAKIKARNTCLQKYGVEYYGQSEQGRQSLSDRYKDPEYREKVKQSIEETNLKKYGVKSVLSLKEVRDKCKATYKEKTGYDHPYQDPEVREKLKSGTIAKFGSEYALQSDKGKEQVKLTNLERYGVENPMKNAIIQEKARQTCIEKYGTDNYAKTQEFKNKFVNTMLTKYGVKWYSETDEHKLRTMKDPSKFDKFKEFDNDPSAYILSHYQDKPSLLQLSNDLGVGTEAVSVRVARSNCRELVAYVRSTLEREVLEFIQSLGDDIRIEENTHKIITPKEIDIYLPDYKFGIECNPASTHNSTVDTWEITNPPMSPNYHKIKTDECEAKDVFLFHIFGYDWSCNQDVIKSMIRNILGKNIRKIYARNCFVKEVDSRTCKEFLDNNHRQKSANSPIRLGLFCNDELVSIMTFGRMRGTIGTGKSDLSDCYELVRFCSLLNTSVVGGADKLFKHFVRQFNPSRIRSFSDRAHTRGNLYKKLGFVEISRSDPGYVWVNIYNDRPYHRTNAQKSHIKEFLKDESIDLNKTEKQIMEEHGFVQVYDSGTITWEWNHS